MKKPHGIMFHYFHNDSVYKKGPGSISSKELEDIILYYKERYNLISADEWLYKTQNNLLNSKDVFLSFDDCIRSQYDIAYPILEKYDIKAFWSIYTSVFEGEIEKLEVYRHFRWETYKNMEFFYKDFFNHAVCMEKDLKVNISEIINNYDANQYLKGMSFYTYNDRLFRYLRNEILTEGRYNIIMDELIKKKNYSIDENKKYLWFNKSELKEIYLNGHTIGLHTHTHPTFLQGFTVEKQTYEYMHNKEALESILGTKVCYMSHPCNSYNNDTLEILKNMGIKIGFRANMQEGYNTKFEYPRDDSTNVYNEMTKKEKNNNV